MNKIILVIIMILESILISAQDFALKQLENSPRHHEWVQVASGERKVNCFVAYPEKPKNTLAVIVIHENRGLTDWVRSFADQLAAAGYLAIAPDLLSDFNETRKKTGSFENSDQARDAIYQLDPNQVTADLNAVNSYISGIPSSNGSTVVIGFCWGGSQTFLYATNNEDIKAALVFYGGAPDDIEEIKRIKAPVYGFYGGDDQRVNAGIPNTEKLMQQAGKFYEYKIYPGAGHAFMRRGDDPGDSAENKQARDQSWVRIKEILSSL
ncbi:MAG: dienelactone hydrolase family protein [Bacteroidales bacterium]|nr:dienelactone hydrolase family protein [Bacteroidales bacterium]